MFIKIKMFQIRVCMRLGAILISPVGDRVKYSQQPKHQLIASSSCIASGKLAQAVGQLEASLRCTQLRTDQPQLVSTSNITQRFLKHIRILFDSVVHGFFIFPLFILFSDMICVPNIHNSSGLETNLQAMQINVENCFV